MRAPRSPLRRTLATLTFLTLMLGFALAWSPLSVAAAAPMRPSNNTTPRPEDPPSPEVLAWLADHGRSFVERSGPPPEDVALENLSFGQPVRALTWSTQALSPASGEGDDAAAETALPALPTGPMVPGEPRGLSVPHHDEQTDPLPLDPDSDPIVLGLIEALDAWWVPLVQGEEAVGLIEVTRPASPSGAELFWSRSAGAAVQAEPRRVVHDAFGLVRLDSGDVRSLDARARAHIAGPIPTTTYLQGLRESLRAEAQPPAPTEVDSRPVTITLLVLAAIGIITLMTHSWSVEHARRAS
ncbi:MAG: hypothetical protein Q4P36_09250 [Bowdeniella nasicola]|nr:hypothetical protein [Bowdeniella nasicola]